MEGARRDEQYMVGFHRPIFGRDGGSFNQGQQVALNPFAADRPAAPRIRHRNLVNFVQEYDAIGLCIGKRDPVHIVLVKALFGFFLDQFLPRIGHLHLAPFQIVLAKCLAHHLAKIDHPDIATHARYFHRHRRIVGHFDFNFDLVHVPVANALAECFACRLACRVASQRFQNTLHRGCLGGFAHMFAAALFFQAHSLFGQIAGNLFDVAADIADFGEFGGLDLDEWRIGQLGQTAGNLGLAAPRGANHQDVFGGNLVAQIRAETLAAPAIAQRNGNRPLCVRLANDMFVECSHNGFWGQCVFHYDLNGKLRTAFK